MRLAQVLQFDQRQAMGHRRKVPAGSTAVIIPLFGRGHRADTPMLPALPDDDRFAGRGRDPG